MLGECCALRRSRYFCPWARFGWCLTARYTGHSREEGRSQRAEKNFYVCIIFWSCHRMWSLFYKPHAYFLFLCCNSPPSLYFFCPPFLELLLILWLFLSFLFHYPSFCISLLRVPLICFKQFWFFFHLTYNDRLNHPLISHFLNINNKCIAHVHWWSFSIHLCILLSAHMLHEFKSIKISMTMRNSFGCNFAIRLWTDPQMQIKTILTHFICIFFPIYLL